MTNKIATITIKDLDITQLVKCAAFFSDPATRCAGNYRTVYNQGLYELLGQLIEAGYAGQREITATPLTIYNR